MKEPKVQVGILFEPQIKFILLTPYHINGEEVSGKQVVNCRMSPSVSIFIGNERKTSVLSEH